MNKIRFLLLAVIVMCFSALSAKGNVTPQNRFNVDIRYSQTSGFIPTGEILWHYNDKVFSSLYGNYFVSAEKKTLAKYENSRYALFSRTFVLGSEVIGFYVAKRPAFFSLSLGLEYKRMKDEEFGFFDIGSDTVTFEDIILKDMLFPFLKLRIDNYSENVDNRFSLVFFPTYCLLLDQEIFFKPLTKYGYDGNSSKWQVPAVEVSDEVLFKFSKYGGILLNAAFAFWQAKYESAVLEQGEETYRYGKAEVEQNFIEYSVSMSYVIPFEIAGTIRPKIGVGLSGSVEFRDNDGKKSTNKDIGYLFLFGFHY